MQTLGSAIRTGSLSAQVAAELGRRIVGRVYAAGATLPPEASLLEEFDVSRSVLRDAVKALESKGLLEARQRRGTCVTPRDGWNMLDAEVLGWIAQSDADPDFLIRLTEVRLIVEPGACDLAAQVGNEVDLKAIEAAWQRMVDNVDDVKRFVAADRDFHFAVLRAAGNEYLAAFGTAISAALTVSLNRTNPTPQSNRASLASHERILVALRNRDGNAAANESRRQLAEAMQRLRSGVSKT